ncbi:MAG TPA: ExbD/TolR family protein [Acidobacteriota bacterium]|nr:ExbD/TolR family protein [Acidobacteriota bacterium]
MSTGGGGGRTNVNAEINVTPMADIMLVLLIIFMITTPLIQEGVPINKPKARHAREAPQLDAEGVTTVTVNREGLFFINSEPVPPEEFVDKLADSRARAPELPLFVRGDVAAPYGRVVEVVNLARDAGYEQIGMVVDRQEGGGAAGAEPTLPGGGN